MVDYFGISNFCSPTNDLYATYFITTRVKFWIAVTFGPVSITITGCNLLSSPW